jgi:hypothetical protein
MRDLLNSLRDWFMEPVTDCVRHSFRAFNARLDATSESELLCRLEELHESVNKGTINAIHKWINDSRESRAQLEKTNRELLSRWKSQSDLFGSEIERLRKENEYLRETIEKMFAEEDEASTVDLG